jgi:hypothetical protein
MKTTLFDIDMLYDAFKAGYLLGRKPKLPQDTAFKMYVGAKFRKYMSKKQKDDTFVCYEIFKQD